MNSRLVEVCIGLACLAVVVVAGVYVAQHVTCVHIPYLVDSCVVSK